MGQQIPPGDHLPRVQGQVVQQVELAPAEVDCLAVESDLMSARVQPEAGDLKRVPGPGAARLCPPQDRPDPGLDLVCPERLDDVVVRPCVKRPDDLGLIVARGDDQHGHGADGTDHAQRFLPAEVGQP